jgi:hypothetical protein
MGVSLSTVNRAHMAYDPGGKPQILSMSETSPCTNACGLKFMFHPNKRRRLLQHLAGQAPVRVARLDL